MIVSLNAGDYLGFVIVLLSLLLLYIFRLAQRKEPLTGPTENWLLGNLTELGRKGYHTCQLEWTAKYGSLYRYYMGQQCVIAVLSPELIRELCLKKFKAFPHRPLPPHLPPQSLRGILFSKGNYWEAVRNRLLPLFHSSSLEKVVRVVHNCALKFQRKLETVSASEEAIVNVQELAEAMSLDVMIWATFGLDLCIQENEKWSEFAKAFADQERSTSKTSFSVVFVLIFPWIRPFLHFLLPKVPFLVEYENKRRFAYLLNCVQELINQSLVVKEVEKNYRFENVLSLLKRVKFENGEMLKDFELRLLVFGMLGAGSSTTATTIACTLYEISKDTKVQEKIHLEIEKYYNSSKMEDNEGISLEDLNTKFPFLEMVVKEALRLYPTGAMIAREANNDASLGNLPIQKGSPVVVPLYALHRDPIAFPSPEEFIPERFETKSPYFTTLASTKYFPFGLGPRMCIGHKFAMYEVMITLVLVCKKFKFEIPNGNSKAKLELNPGLNLKPLNGVFLHVTSRNV